MGERHVVTMLQVTPALDTDQFPLNFIVVFFFRLVVAQYTKSDLICRTQRAVFRTLIFHIKILT